ncbi:GW dipeptide domain-containing protein [Lentilactobacillus laojiaonis]|uniref:GW dipeptide domain-containing protein n=1 Tax=Lentilactobacillus laojiaonis TaxID=2883998 RepID=UPI001D0B37C5|nr:GW dipeptide domain-containing protein [Lentilactobacillus laojiaonis]UDM32204.1 S-layer protein [Lentilactobacillus laojiaonis]
MKSSLKNSLFIGLAALGFVAAAGSVNADAATTSNGFHNLTTPASSRNVSLTGANAIYNKPGTIKGAKTVVSTTTAAKLASSTNSAKANFRAYGYTETSRGSVYYKVVNMDGSYRGYVYGGKTLNKYAGGVKSFATTKDASLTSDEKSTTYVFKTPGKENNGEELTYAAPMYTQYKLGRKIMDSTDYAKDKLKVTKAATRTREGDRWVYVEDADNSNVNGWIKASGLKAYNSEGVNQTTVSMVFNYSNYDQAGQKNTNAISNISGLRLLFNSNVNFTNSVNTFNRDTAVKGNKNDVLPKSKLVSTLEKDGLKTVYMKITPTLIPRLGGGIVDNLDSTGVFMKFNLDTDDLPNNVHYGDKLRLSYTIEPSVVYVKSAKQTLIDDKTQNADGYYPITVSNDIIADIINRIATNEF